MSAHLEIDEVIPSASLSTETLPTTESTTPLNPKINLEKYKHTCQIENLNYNNYFIIINLMNLFDIKNFSTFSRGGQSLNNNFYENSIFFW